MEIISKRKIRAGHKIVARETMEERGENALRVLRKELAGATVLEKPALEKKIAAWEKKLAK